jgi:hypothetical protein
MEKALLPTDEPASNASRWLLDPAADIGSLATLPAAFDLSLTSGRSASWPFSFDPQAVPRPSLCVAIDLRFQLVLKERGDG